MPTRLIRESLIDSERYAQCSTEAKLFFVHLMLVADDIGCVQVSPTFLRRRCFHDAPTNESIARLLNELQDQDLIRLYEVERQALGFIPRFGQRMQRITLKHPAPPESLYLDDKDACTKFNEINNKAINQTVVQPLPNRGKPPEVEVEVEVEVKTKAVSAKRGTRLNVDSLPEPWKDFCKQTRPDLTPESVFDGFKDFWAAAPGSKGVKADWLATWRNWVRNQRGGMVIATKKKAPAKPKCSVHDCSNESRWRSMRTDKPLCEQHYHMDRHGILNERID